MSKLNDGIMRNQIFDNQCATIKDMRLIVYMYSLYIIIFMFNTCIFSFVTTLLNFFPYRSFKRVLNILVMLWTSYHPSLIISKMFSWRFLYSHLKYANIRMRCFGECGCYLDFPKNKTSPSELELHNRLEATFVPSIMKKEIHTKNPPKKTLVPN